MWQEYTGQSSGPGSAAEITLGICIIKLPKSVKIKIFKRAVGEGETYYVHKKQKIRMTADFTLETIQEKQWSNIFKPEIKTINLEFYNQQSNIFQKYRCNKDLFIYKKLKELITTRNEPEEMLKEDLRAEET